MTKFADSRNFKNDTKSPTDTESQKGEYWEEIVRGVDCQCWPCVGTGYRSDLAGLMALVRTGRVKYQLSIVLER